MLVVNSPRVRSLIAHPTLNEDARAAPKPLWHMMFFIKALSVSPIVIVKFLPKL